MQGDGAAAIRLRAAADMVRPVRVLEEVLPSVVKALMAASRRSRSCRSCWMIAFRFAMAGDSNIIRICSLQLRALRLRMVRRGQRFSVQALVLLRKNPLLALFRSG
jgi:hypothetical protein